MKHSSFFRLPYLLAGLFICSVLTAQDSVMVNPGKGTLEAAIAKNGGDAIYYLQAGERYGLESILEVSSQTLGGAGKTLTIIGEKTDEMPAIIQVGNNADGSVHSEMFTLKANLTLKNVFISDQDKSGEAGTKVFNLQARIRLVLDQCVIDPAGTNRTFAGGDKADRSVFYLTNCQIYRNGHMQGANDGGWLGGMSWDTLWVENNTLVSSGQDFIGTPFHNQPNNQFIWINHNTFLWHDVWIKKSYTDQNFYFTNNLMHDISLFPELPRWYKFFPDFDQGNNLLCQIAIDTLEIDGTLETLPSQRRMFWEYNLMYYSPGVQEVPKYAADNNIELAYLIPMVWDEDVPLSYTGGVLIGSMEDSCRENRILADPASWPYMKYDHNWYDLDPLYNDPMIYSINDSVGEHILGFYRSKYWEEPGAPDIDDLPSYNWSIDNWNDVSPADYPVTWPRFDGTYNNESLLTSSIESLPMGDLNWYPDQKKLWFANRVLVEKHILDLNEEQFKLLDPDSIFYNVALSVVNERQEPLPGAWLIIGEDTLSASDDDGRIFLDTFAGTYNIKVIVADYLDFSEELSISYSSLRKTIVMQKPSFELLFVVVNGENAGDSIENASIVMEGLSGTLLTDEHGKAGVETSGVINYTVSKTGFFDNVGTVELFQATVELVELSPDKTDLYENESGIKIYPNPARKYLQVLAAKEWINGIVQLIDLQGSICLEASLTSGTVSLDLKELDGSVYFLRFTKGKRQSVYKVVVLVN